MTDLNAFSALTLLIGHQEKHPACKNWSMRCWYGYLSVICIWSSWCHPTHPMNPIFLKVVLYCSTFWQIVL